MVETDLKKLFLILVNTYPNFDATETKKAIWLDLLCDVTFENAQRNLRAHILNPENRFPPHPGILAEKPVQSCIGNYVPNAEETRLMLENRDRLLLDPGSSSIPETARERMRQLGYKLRSE